MCTVRCGSNFIFFQVNNQLFIPFLKKSFFFFCNDLICHFYHILKINIYNNIYLSLLFEFIFYLTCLWIHQHHSVLIKEILWCFNIWQIQSPLYIMGYPSGSVVKNQSANVGDVGSISDSGRPPGDGNGNPPRYSCLGNPMDGGA